MRCWEQFLQRYLRRNDSWDTERLCVWGRHSTFLLNHPLSLPCLLLLIFRAALQYFYQMISPSSSAALMFMKMILCRNASCMPRCHCLSSSLASLFMYKYVCVGGGGVVTDWLALFIISWGCVWGSYAKVKCVCVCVFDSMWDFSAICDFVRMCYCYFRVSRDWDVDCVKVHLLPFWQSPG